MDDKSASDGPRWLAGDHHVHSQFSVGYDRTVNPPKPIIGGDALYPIPLNVSMARSFGLEWTVATDHGGPNHSKVNRELAYPELLQSREQMPDVIQFYGMELNTPGADHSSLIIPKTGDEANVLANLESTFDKYEAWPIDADRDQPGAMLAALRTMDKLPEKPVVIANHPSRSASGLGQYGLDEPAEFRDWNDTAPDVAVGMAGAPGHQAAGLGERKAHRGGYARSPTLGGFDQMTARLGGFWDSMLGEGRHWWITANSDSHRHYDVGGIDFWPGEYSKTYVFAKKNHAAILDGIRHGHVFVTTGDLISALTISVGSAEQTVTLGEELKLDRPGPVTIKIRLTDPAGPNHHNDAPSVARVDLIVGRVTGPTADRSADTNPSTRIEHRFLASDWTKTGETLVMSHTLMVDAPIYIRVRGTSTDQLEPEPDVIGEDPWQDLWFYANPIFVSVAGDS